MITKNKNKKNLTIDLKAIIAKDYLYSKKSIFYKIIKEPMKLISIIWIFLYILISFWTWGGYIQFSKANANEVLKNGVDIQNRNEARLQRLKICNKNKKYLKKYYLKNQDIGTRCATIMTLTKDRIPVKFIMQDIHTPTKAKNFWKIYYNIKQIRIQNNIPVQVELKRTSKEPQKNLKKFFDINKLAKAVAKHETADCKKWNSASRNNCFWIMTWKRGFREFKKYKNKEESYKDFKKIWTTYYKWMPNFKKAKKYSWNDRANIWLKNVLYFYYN